MSSKKIYDISKAALRVQDLPQSEQPRMLFDRVGAGNVSDQILLALILRTGVKGLNVVQLAQDILLNYGSLTDLAQTSVEELAALRGMGKIKAQILKAALELATRIAAEATPEKVKVVGPEQVATVLREMARSHEEEVFWVLLLDGRNRLKRAPVEITRGLLNASLVHPREVFREAIRSSSAAVVLAHNHPSGDPTPSAEDIKITRQLVDAGKIINIDVLDHVVLGRMREPGSSDYVSLRESGMVKFED